MVNLNLKAVSLFSNVGIAETFFEELGIQVIVANELVKTRAELYSKIYPDTKVINGDITNKEVYNAVISEARTADLLVATPPCQGMSTAGRKNPEDPRNNLVTFAINAIKDIKPKFVILENVPMQLKTKIKYNNEKLLIPDYIYNELNEDYIFNTRNIVNSMDYGVPQSRRRFFYLLVRKDLDFRWEFPLPYNNIVTLKDVFEGIPELDPYIREEEERHRFPDFEKKQEEGLLYSNWHIAPTHSWKHVEWMIHTPSGKSAFQNEIFYPKKDDRRIKGAPRTYMRMDWNKPATTVMQNNGTISSFSSVHPGREIVTSELEEKRYFSDPRVLSIYELMKVTSLPDNWRMPINTNHSEIRKVIGEGIPPLLLKEALIELNKLQKNESYSYLV